MKEYLSIEDLLNPDSIKTMRKKQVVEKYISIVEQVYDKKRDKELSSYLDQEVVSTSTIIEIIDKYEKRKEGLVNHMRETITVTIKDEA